MCFAVWSFAAYYGKVRLSSELIHWPGQMVNQLSSVRKGVWLPEDNEKCFPQKSLVNLKFQIHLIFELRKNDYFTRTVELIYHHQERVCRRNKNIYRHPYAFLSFLLFPVLSPFLRTFSLFGIWNRIYYLNVFWFDHHRYKICMRNNQQFLPTSNNSSFISCVISISSNDFSILNMKSVILFGPIIDKYFGRTTQNNQNK